MGTYRPSGFQTAVVNKVGAYAEISTSAKAVLKVMEGKLSCFIRGTFVIVQSSMSLRSRIQFDIQNLWVRLYKVLNHNYT